MTDTSWHPVTDPGVAEFFTEITPMWLGHLLVFLTYLGSVFVVVPLVVAAYWRDPERFAHWIPAVVGYYGLMTAIKSLNSAVRPTAEPPVGAEHAPALFAGTYEHATAISTTSFPSGNVIAATVLAGLFVLDSRLLTRTKRLGIAVILVALVSYTRLGLGVHYPVDVVAGVFIGITFVGGILVVRRVATDETAALFILAAVLTVGALILRMGITLSPDITALAGSNRPVAVGAAIGGFVVWHLISRRPQPDGRQAKIASILALTATVGGGYLLVSVLTHPVLAALGGAIAFGGAVAVPWTLPAQSGLVSWVGFGSRERDVSAWPSGD